MDRARIEHFGFGSPELSTGLYRTRRIEKRAGKRFFRHTEKPPADKGTSLLSMIARIGIPRLAQCRYFEQIALFHVWMLQT